MSLRPKSSPVPDRSGTWSPRQKVDSSRPRPWGRKLGHGALAALSVLAAAQAVTACRPAASAPADTSTLTVFAAASLTDVFEAIGEVYERDHPGAEVVFNFGASSALRTQLIEGASLDVVAFAGMKDMQQLEKAGLVDSEAVHPFAANELVVVVHPASVGRVAALADLADPGVTVVLAAQGVPAGDYARQVLENLARSLGAAYRDGVLANVVSEEDNVRQVLAKVQLGEVDAGWVYRSDALTAPELKVIEVPAADNVRASYPIARLLDAPQPEAAGEFIELVLSAEGQRLIQEAGFLPVAP